MSFIVVSNEPQSVLLIYIFSEKRLNRPGNRSPSSSFVDQLISNVLARTGQLLFFCKNINIWKKMSTEWATVIQVCPGYGAEYYMEKSGKISDLNTCKTCWSHPKHLKFTVYFSLKCSTISTSY